MDIFVIGLNSVEDIPAQMLLEYKKRDITDGRRLNQHCLSYLMIDRVLREFYQIEDREIAFEGAKPYLKSNEKYFSLSHSGDFVALAFSDVPCGIDIEKKKDRDYKAIAKRLKFDVDTEEEFYKEWTKYEAEYKLGSKSNSSKTYLLGEYFLTVVSLKVNEECELYFQSN